MKLFFRRAEWQNLVLTAISSDGIAPARKAEVPGSESLDTFPLRYSKILYYVVV